MADGENETLGQVVGSLLNDFAQVWRNSEREHRSKLARFFLLWLGAMTFLYPLFLVHFATDAIRYYGGGTLEFVLLSVAGIVPCAIGASFVGWLSVTDRTGQSKVRLFLTGFLLPYLVVVLLVPIMQVNGGGQ